MHDLRGTVVLGVLLLLGSTSSACGAEYRDPSGFSLVYPQGWSAVPAQLALGNREAIPPRIRVWLDKNSVNLEMVAFLLVRDGEEDYHETVNVVVDKQQIPLNASSLKTLETMLPKQYESMGATVEKIEGRLETVGVNPAMVFDYRARFSDQDGTVRQRQVFIPGGGKTFIVTCTAKADSFDEHARAFDEILASMKVPPPNEPRSIWARIAAGGVAGVVPGALAGLIGGLIVMFGKKGARARNQGR